jgi:hypothetical protein
LTHQLAADLGNDGSFDGNDHDDPAPGSGLQVGVCAPMASCPAADSTDACARATCRTACDLYSGTPRSLLAGEITKVIRDPMLNQTGLAAADILPVARAISGDAAPGLFAATACPEGLDRIPPTLMLAAKPADGDFVHGTVTFGATAIDDVDLPPAPPVQIVGFQDTDGAPTNNVATVMIDTTVQPDGPLTVAVTSTDAAGNTAMAMRVWQVDNTAPIVALNTGDTGFVLDAATLWVNSATPTLTGTLVELHPAAVEAVVGATHYQGTISGSNWSVTLASLDANGSDVRIVVTDAAGNQGTLLQRVAYDDQPPQVSFPALASRVSDEATETPIYSLNQDPSLDEIPNHMHGAASVDLSLGTEGQCASVSLTKFAYLLDNQPPIFGTENVRNPLHYQLLASDAGIGIDPASAVYRVGRDVNGSIQWLTSFAPMPATISGSAVIFDVSLYSFHMNPVPGLATIEGIYHFDAQIPDRLGHFTEVQRCFSLHLRAAPLHFNTNLVFPAVIYMPGDANGHKFALQAAGLEQSKLGQIAQRVLNTTAAAALTHMTMINGTAETVYLTVTVTPPSEVKVRQTFSIRYVTTTTTINVDCSDSTTGDCANVPVHPEIADGANPAIPTSGMQEPVAVNGLQFPVQVYLLDVNGVPTTQILCMECQDTDATFRFAIPSRLRGGPALRFLVMSMVDQVTQLQPQDSNHILDTRTMFSDVTINPMLPALPVRITGFTLASISGCSHFDSMAHCRERTTYKPYRALTSAALIISAGFLSTAYQTSATTDIQPVEATPPKRTNTGWSTVLDVPLPQ